MSKWFIILSFVAGAALSWGVYVPIVHEAAIKLGSNLRAFLFVGVAYFLVAVLIPTIIIFGFSADPTEKAQPNWKPAHIGWGLAAGTAGAVGALSIIFAATTAGPGAALYVAPMVFAGAPIVNTIASMTYFHPVKAMPDWRFFLGLAMAAGGMVMVNLFKPPA